MRLLIVRLSALGDVVHTLPLAAALRRAFPDGAIDWVVDERNADLLTLVPVLDRVVVLRTRSRPALPALAECRRTLRRRGYDVALDAQGLGKSALVARLSGAARIVGFATPFLRERWARWLYTERVDPCRPRHVVARNLGLGAALGVDAPAWSFPIRTPSSEAPARTRARLGLGAATALGSGRFALLNPNAAWASKRWPAERFGAVASWLRRTHRLPSAVLWGPGDEARAAAVADASDGAAAVAPPTGLRDLVALARAAAVMVSGDTGPLHVAAAVGTPVVGLYGPSDPSRNGPWSPDDVVVSRFAACRCRPARGGAGGSDAGSSDRMVRVCRSTARCLDDIPVEVVTAAVDRRLRSVLPDA